MLTKNLLRVSRAGGGYRPQFVGSESRPLAARVLGVFQGHVGEPRRRLDDALSSLEAEAEDFKLVRGFAALLDREATFEVSAPLPPRRVRRTAFEEAERAGVPTTPDERAAVLDAAADRLGSDASAVESSLYADREVNEVLTGFDARWSPDDLLARYDRSPAQTEEWDRSDGVDISPDNLVRLYNISLAQTALFDATELRIRCSDPRTLVTAVKRLRLMYEIRTDDDGWEVVVTGPDSLFRNTRRYGTTFARLLRTVAKMAEWEVTATIDDRGTERTMKLSDEDPIDVLGPETVAEMSFDSGVEADFAARFGSVDLDWELAREPEPLAVGASVMIPDFAFDYKFGDFRVFFEIMGFWTPEYVEKKLEQLETVDDVEMLVAVDESLGVSEDIEARDHRAIPYSGSVRLKDVRDALRRYEEQLTTAAVSELPDELRPDADAISLEALAAERGVSEDVLDGVAFPEHQRVGRTLVRSAALEDIAAKLEPGLSYREAEEAIASWNITDTSSVLSTLGYEVKWEGLSGGTLRPKR
ncbi:hypothetical protein C474_02486 [Halogeometricum pallidum JCM 14848]|uniref:DUF790 family protein n=1 Tax=Halogeometricum pallidum JCM 14848 TaxID=1227487 RepID=M0DGD3_HALPD|nr:DUF790 family protein [Halogeometricum pallidum]ELZ34536.1 hypothetical protein C474_02486 [Halogeometricum pallidum JCM 14848]